MAKTFTACANCNNSTSGDSVYRCDKCKKVFCKVCLPNGGCDGCGAKWGIILSAYSRVGAIG